MSEFSLTNPGDLMSIHDTTGRNLALWGAIIYELGHYTSLVRTAETSDEWYVFESICSMTAIY